MDLGRDRLPECLGGVLGGPGHLGASCPEAGSAQLREARMPLVGGKNFFRHFN
jgi:hypothetical protein